MSSKKVELNPEIDTVNDEILEDLMADQPVDDGNDTSRPPENENVLEKIDLEKFILDLELMFNEMLKKKDDNLGFEKDQLVNHSKLAAVVIKKNLGEYSQFTPEIALLVTSLTMAASQMMIFRALNK